jgi:hydroxyacylglutathione hydrolase
VLGEVAGRLTAIRLRGVNCYLIEAGEGFVLIDTGAPQQRARLEEALERAGCRPGKLRLVALTHGDYDHAGNAAYLREKYSAKIGMHREDSERVELADWDLGMKTEPDRFTLLFRAISKLALRFIDPSRFETFTPDVFLEDGQTLSDYGVDATVLHLPGHTRGSIGILTAEGDLFCGDLMQNMLRPSLHFFIDDMTAARAGIERLRGLGVKSVYPGHGRPFPLERLKESGRLTGRWRWSRGRRAERVT